MRKIFFLENYEDIFHPFSHLFLLRIFAAVNENSGLALAQSLPKLNKDFIDHLVNEVLCDAILSRPKIEFKVISNNEFATWANQLIKEFSVEHKEISYILEKATLANYKKQVVEGDY
jgi:hypothetical protein